MAMPLPFGKTRYQRCTKCNWKQNIGSSDWLLIFLDKCPKCHSETKIAVENICQFSDIFNKLNLFK